MATAAQRTSLLAHTCPHCGAGVGEGCTVARPARRDAEGGLRVTSGRPITTLDGGCHDARWQAAGLGTAPVLTDVVRERHARPQALPSPVPAGRPW